MRHSARWSSTSCWTYCFAARASCSSRHVRRAAPRRRDRNELVARAAIGIEEEVEQGVRIPVGGGFAGRVAAEARPIVLENVRRAHVLNPILREKGIESLLGVPLLVRGKVIGVLHVGTSPTASSPTTTRSFSSSRRTGRLSVSSMHGCSTRSARRATRVEHVQAITDAALAAPRGDRAAHGAAAENPHDPRRRHLRVPPAGREDERAGGARRGRGSRRRSSRA